MNKNQFSSENMLLSVVGHLALVALMVTSFFVVIERAKLVAPDRVQITEIDLSMVKVTGNETQLYNTDTPKPEELSKVEFPERKDKPNPKTDAEDFGDDKPIDAPSLVDTPAAKPSDKNKDTADDKPLLKKKMVVRVNRETVSLDRTMTISVIDALRVALTRCWVVDTTRDDIADIRAVAHLTMNKTGTVRDVWFESAARSENDPAFAYVLETIRGALATCQPFKMLPASEFDAWEKIQLTFYPTQGTIM